jgi:hypothetical protein
MATRRQGHSFYALQDSLSDREQAGRRYEQRPKPGQMARDHYRWLLAWAAESDGQQCGPDDPDHWAHAALRDVYRMAARGLVRLRPCRAV